MSRRPTNDADASRWLDLTLAIDLAVADPKKMGVANLVSPRSWHALIYIGTRLEQTAGYKVMGEELRLPRRSMTRVVQVLERERYVVRGYDASTGTSWLRVTQAGRDALAILYSQADQSITVRSATVATN